MNSSTGSPRPSGSGSTGGRIAIIATSTAATAPATTPSRLATPGRTQSTAVM
jgi:hypothetical protein